jgi:electron transport complex protein RnfD
MEFNVKHQTKKSEHHTERFFTDQLLILIGLSVAAIYYYGVRAGAVIAVSVLTAVICGALTAKLMKKPLSGLAVPDIVSGLITGLMLPAQTSFLTIFIAALFAALLCRAVFGGFANEFVSPSAVSYLFIYYAFGSGLLLSVPVFDKLPLTPVLYPENLAPSYFADILSYGVTEASVTDLLLGRLTFYLGGGVVILLIIGAVFFALRRDLSIISLSISLVLFAGIALLTGDYPVKSAVFCTAALLFPSLFCIMPFTRNIKTLDGKILYGIAAGLVLSAFVLYAKQTAGGFFAAVLLSPLALYLTENEFVFLSLLPKKLRFVKLEKL